MIRFWIHADWLDEADKDLEQLLTLLPAEKARYAKLKSEVNALRAENLMAEIERARESGRHQWAIKALEAFPKQDVPRSVSEKVTGLRAEYDAPRPASMPHAGTSRSFRSGSTRPTTASSPTALPQSGTRSTSIRCRAWTCLPLSPTGRRRTRRT